MKTKTLAFAFAAMGVFGGGLAYAQSAESYKGEDEKEVHAIARAKIGLAEAITTAERETSGKALDAAPGGRR